MDLNELLARLDPLALAAGGGVVGGLTREIIRWRTLLIAGKAALYAQPLFLIVAVLEVALGGGLAALTRYAFPGPAPAVALIAAFLLGAGFEEVVRRGANLRMFSNPTLGADGQMRRPTLTDFLRA